MTGLMQRALGDSWNELPPSLQAHYLLNKTKDIGRLNVSYPRLMQGYLNFLRMLGALVNRSGENISTVVEKQMEGDRHYWRRVITYPNGKVIRFNSFWVYVGGNQLIEFVNPFIGLQMAAHVKDRKLHYRGIRFVVRLRRWLLPIPEWLVLGHTTIVEEAVGDKYFMMDFRLTHPWFGEVFRYGGKFETIVE